VDADLVAESGRPAAKRELRVAIGAAAEASVQAEEATLYSDASAVVALAKLDWLAL
jgi:hypothetical protein